MKHDNGAHKLHLNKLYGRSVGEGHTRINTTGVPFYVKTDSLHAPKPGSTYQLLESIPEAANRDFTVAQVERGHRYGIPYPVSADHATGKYGNPYER